VVVFYIPQNPFKTHKILYDKQITTKTMEKFDGKHPLHIKNPELQKSGEVSKSVEKHERLNKEKLPNDPTDRIEAHMDRLEKIFLNPDENVRKRNLELLKPAIYDEFVIKPEEVPEQAFILEQQIARRLGYGDVEITEEFKERKTEQIINDQKHSLDRWIDYLTSDDAMYPTWSKYFAFNSILKMGGLKKTEDEEGNEKAIFKKRKKDTVASFPPLNPRALALTISVLEKQLKRDGSEIKNESTKLNDEEFQKLTKSENFSKIYAQFLIELPEYSTEGSKEIRGEWVKYDKNSDPDKLVESLDGYPLEWCTANPDTAKSHLEGGDFYVYYSLDQDANPKIPRLAIRMENDNIKEVRGIAPDQNLDPYITPVLDKKMEEFGQQGEVYKKKSENMRKLTEIEDKLKENSETQLSTEELKFLYEIDSPIQGFGYKKDPRIEEILRQRNPTEDLPILFDCEPSQIATNKSEINENTKVYNGELYPNIFKELPKTIEKIYTNFPEKISEVYIKEIEIPSEPKTAEQYITDLEKDGHNVYDYAKDILSKANLEAGKGQKIKLIIPSNKSLGFPQGATRAESKQRAQELGIANETPSAITGPELRKQYTDQPNPSYILIDMDFIIDYYGNPRVFGVNRYGAGSGLDANSGRPSDRWRDYHRWSFSQ